MKRGEWRRGESIEALYLYITVTVISQNSRTPMKRLSYMHDYATPDGTVIRVHPVVHSPRLLQSLSRARKTNATPAVTSISAKKTAFHQKNVVKFGNQHSHWEDQENVQPCIKPMLKAQCDPVSTTKPSRRYMCVHCSPKRLLVT